MQEAAEMTPAQFDQIVKPNDLINAFDQYASKIKILSLDCFDTILWRNTVEPIDVFYDLQHQATFKALGMNALMRQQSERAAARMNRVQNGSSQVKLADIYRMSFPELSDEQVEQLITEELAAEKEACFAFPPMVQLINHAHQLKKKIVIVSDTYLTEAQLKELLASRLPQETMQKITKIFCSCEYNLSKSEGLLKLVARKMDAQPQNILHIGDNPQADFDAAKIARMHAFIFKHYDENVYELVRMQAAAAGFLDPSIRINRALTNPYLGLLAMGLDAKSPASMIGYASIGPILYAFGQYIIEEVTKLKATGKKTKILFLLRDAYLPELATKALSNEHAGHLVRISRFTSLACSFRSKRDVQLYLAQTAQSSRFKTICTQLLLPAQIAEPLIKKANQAARPIDTFMQLITEEKILKIIFENANQYRTRFKRYLEKTIDLQRGDTLVFVDLGYSGTAQTKLSPVMAEEWGVEIVGRYLIAARTPGWSATKSGLIDPDAFDDKALAILVTYIGLFEKICANNDASVIDFAEDGSPVYEESDIKHEQFKTLVAIQNECIRFVKDAAQYFKSTMTKLSPALLRDMAAISLCRFIFLPSKQELDFMQDLKFDFNLGTNEVMPVFDIEKGITSLRRRSWLHGLKDNIENMRTNYPAEWRAANLELALTLMAQHRFDFKFTLDDLSQRKETLKIIVMQGQEISHIPVDATPTHDGYYALQFPVGSGNYHIGILFGEKFKWVEVESAEIMKMNAMYTQAEAEHTDDASPHLGLDKIVCHDNSLLECAEDGLFIFAPQKPFDKQHQYVLRVIFRPIVKREAK